jgi:hypothetical protein
MVWWMPFLEKKSQTAFLLIFFTSAVNVISLIYGNALFLGSYPGHWVAYLLVAQSLSNAMLSLVLTPLIIKNPKKNSLWLFIGCGIVVCLIFLLIHVHLFWVPFIASVILNGVSLLSGVIGWSLISLVFNLHEFKQLGNYTMVAASSGVIITSLIASLFTNEISHQSLLYFMLALIVISTVFIFRLEVKEKPTNAKGNLTNRTSPLRYPLYKNLFIYSILVLAMQALVEYTFKSNLAIHYDKEDIATFLSYFYCVSNLIGLVSSIIITRSLLERLQVPGLFFLLPIFVLLGSIIVLFFPGLWAITVLGSGSYLIYYHYSNLAREISLNILPTTIRLAGKFQIKIIATPIGTGSISLLIILLNRWLGLYQLMVTCIVMSLLITYYIFKIKKLYRTTLQEEIQFRRFNIIEEIHPATKPVFQTIALDALNSPEPQAFLLGLEISKKLKLADYPESFYLRISDKDKLLRMMLANFIRKNRLTNAESYLASQFNIEQDLEVSLILANALIAINPSRALALARASSHLAHAATLSSFRILMALGTSSEMEDAHTRFKKLFQSLEPDIRCFIAKVIGILKLGEHQEFLANLIDDPNNNIAEAAILASFQGKMTRLIPNIVARITPGSIALIARKALRHFGEIVIPTLLEKIGHSKNDVILLHIIADIHGLQAEASLIKIAKEYSIFLRTQAARYMSRRSIFQSICESTKNEVKKLAEEEIRMLRHLTNLQMQSSNEFLKREIASRIFFCKRRLLQWLAITTNSLVVNKLISTLLQSHSDYSSQNIYAKALELLELYIKDWKLAKNIDRIFSDDIPISKIQTSFPFKDIWLETVIQYTGSVSQQTTNLKE